MKFTRLLAIPAKAGIQKSSQGFALPEQKVGAKP